MTFGTSFEQGDIVLVTVPFTDFSSEKQRPALVISNNEYNRKVEDIVVCGITSNIKQEDYSVVIERKDLQEGFLPVTSRVKTDKLFTVHKSVVKRKIAKTNQETLSKVKRELSRLFN